MTRLIDAFCFFVLVCCLISPAAHAQFDTATVLGTVTRQHRRRRARRDGDADQPGHRHRHPPG